MDTNPTPSAAAAAPDPRAARAALLRTPAMRWLLAGSAISLLGDQFTLIALPWAVLMLTHDPLMLGLVTAMVGVPRAAFILIGGAFVDRHSPQRVLMLTKHANTVLLAVLAAGMLGGWISLPLLCALALGIGLAAAFSVPAGSALLPQVVAPAQLPAANGLLMGLRQLSMFAGPLLAALMMGTMGRLLPERGDAPGLALAFGLDAVSFAASAWTLSRVRTRPIDQPSRQAVLQAVAEGLRHCWNDRPLRNFLLYGALVSVMIAGPVQIALPLLAAATPGLGGSGFGLLVGLHGAGTLLGLLVAGLRPHWRLGSLGLTVLGLDAVVGLLFMPLGRIGTVWQGAALLLPIGMVGGFLQVMVFSWLQRRVAPAMMGRAMSVFMFIFVGLAPLSAAATGALMRWVAPTSVFTGAGLLLVAIVMLALLPAGGMRRMDERMPSPAS